MAKKEFINDECYIAIQGWMLNKLKLKGNDLTIFAIIYGFSQDGNNWFTGSQSYLAAWCSCGRTTVHNSLKKLLELNYIIKEDYEVNNIKFCKYKVNLNYVLDIKNNSPQIEQGVQNLNRGCSKSEQGGVQNLNRGCSKSEHNNIYNNINNNNINNIYSQAENKKANEVIIDYLNSKLGTSYKPNTPKTLSLIKQRLKEGFTVDDFKVVIDNQFECWANDSKMKKFLRPETLFGNKFEGYLNSKSNEPLADKFNIAWKKTEDSYERKDNLGEARTYWQDMISKQDIDKRESYATIIYNALQLFLMKYKAAHDSTKYLPTLNNWLEKESSYWIDRYLELELKR